MRTLHITALTLLELRHSRLVVLPLTVAVALALIATNIQNPQTWGEDLLRGMWTGLGVVGALVAILTASGAISADIERGTMQLLAARPVSRTGILVGKLLGILVYLAACVLLWAVVLAFGIGRQVDAGAWTAFLGTTLVIVPMLLAVAVALTASVLFPTRGAIGTSLAVWFAASIVAAIPLASVRPENLERVEAAKLVVGWVLPVDRLADVTDVALDSPMTTGSVVAIGVVVAWLVGAGALFAARSSVAR